MAPNYTHTKKMILKKTQESFPSDLDAVEFGIYLQIEAVLTYSALKDYILPDKLDVLNKIIGDRKRYLGKLTLFKRRMQKKVKGG
jgi:hypothetical protein